MRTFTYTGAKSNRFWNIDLKGTSFTLTYGKVGSAGQRQTWAFPDEARARKEHDRLVGEKLRKGYVETTPAAPMSLRESLERALVDNPDDLASHMADADHLTELGDPRGEFIQVQLAREDPTRPAIERERLRLREQELLQAHQAEWLGEAAPLFLRSSAELTGDSAPDTFDLDDPPYHFGRELNHFHFARGWLQSLHLHGFTPRLAEALGRSPTIALLRQLTIMHSAEVLVLAESVTPGSVHGYDALATWPCLRSLRRF